MAHEKWIDRFGPPFLLFHSGMCIMALHFASVVVRGGSPITPEIYGPAVYAFPAIWWCIVQFAAHLFCAIGVSKRSAVLLTIGAVFGSFVQASFSVLASWAEQGTILQAGALYVTLPMTIMSLMAGIGGLKRD